MRRDEYEAEADPTGVYRHARPLLMPALRAAVRSVSICRCGHHLASHINGGSCVSGRNDADGRDWFCTCRAFESHVSAAAPLDASLNLEVRRD